MSNFDNDSEEITEELLEELKYRKENETDYVDKIENIDDWIKILQKVDDAFFVRNMTQYIMNPNLFGDENDFLDEMRKSL